MKRSHMILLIVLASLFAGWYFLPVSIKQSLTLQGLQAQLETLRALQQNSGTLPQLVFVGVYILVAALSLPIAAVMSLLGGALFGFVQGTILVLWGATTGASLAMIVSRTLLRDWVRKRLGDRIQNFEKGIAKEGAFYLFALRVVPAFPFWVVNLLSGLTPIPLRTFFWVSLIGMAPGTMAYVFAGRQFGHLTSLSGILSPGLFAGLVALGIFPLLSRVLLQRIQAGKVYKGFVRPKSFDYNFIAIGAGAGGLVTSYIGSAVGAKVALIERHKMGGDCLNTGCVPSKALIHAAKVVHQARKAHGFTSNTLSFEIDTAKILAKVQETVRAIAPHDSVERYQSLGVDIFQGEAHLLGPWTVEVNGKRITAPSIVLATGGEPVIPAIPGIEKVHVLTSDTFWDVTHLPRKLVVLGGGPIGSELAQACARLGVKVTQIERSNRLLGREDVEVSALVQERFEADGVVVRTGRVATRFELDTQGQQWIVHAPTAGTGPEEKEPFDAVLVALGRKARHSDWMKTLGIQLRPNGTIDANGLLQTNYPNIYAVGDATGPYQFTHFAAHQAWYAALNALLAPFWSFKADYRVIPWCTYSDPQVARVGLCENDAKEKGIAYESSVYPFHDLDRAIADEETHGFVKVLTVPGKDTILGVTIAGAHAGEMLAEWTLAIQNGLGLKKIMGTIHAYPTFAESSKYAAGIWTRNHKPERALKWARRFFAWRRGA